MSYRALVDKRAALVREAEELFVTAKNAGRPMDVATNRRYVDIQAEVAQLTPQIQAEDLRRDELIASYGPPTDADYARVGQTRPGGPGGPARAARGPRYAEMFGPAPMASGFRDDVDMWQALVYGDRQRFSAVAFDSGQGAGYLVPPQFTSTIFDAALSYEIVRPRATPYTMTSDQLVIAGASHEDGTTGAFGMKPQWISEGGQISQQVPKIRALSLVAWKLAGLVAIPNEILADVANLNQQMTRILSEGLAFTFDQDFLTGDGVGKPQGVLNSPALVTVDAEVSQTAGTIIGANIGRMMSRLPAKSFPNAVWVGSPSVLTALLTLSIVTGATEPLLKQGTKPGSFSLMGMDFLVSEHLPELGTTGDILLCDFTQYAVGMRSDYAVQSSPHLYFDYDVTAMRSIARATGLSLWSTPYTPTANGGLTLSPFVALATRS